MRSRVRACESGGPGVNGPEDDRLDWDAIDWRTVEDDVRRLRQRIFKASQAGHRPRAPGACLSRVPGQLASTVLRGVRRSNAPHLPDVRHEVARDEWTRRGEGQQMMLVA